jgi:hypothetical protein
MLKHVGRLIKSKRRVVVAYRVVPNEPENCIVIATESLTADEHDSLMKVVESAAGQEANELATVLDRSVLPDGRPMLVAFHKTGKLQKQPTNDVEMIPNRTTSIPLNELNDLIAQQQGIAVDDLAVQSSDNSEKSESLETTTPPAATEDTVLTDEEIAANYRSQADALFKEAKKLREQAEDLVPTKKKRKVEASE